MNTHEQQARSSLSQLVAHVFGSKQPISGLTYQDLAFRIGRVKRRGEGHAHGMGQVLGVMGHLLQGLGGASGKPIPYIQSLVISKTGKNRGLPDDGIKEFWPDYPRLTRSEKKNRAQAEYQKILVFGSRWNDILAKLDIQSVVAKQSETKPSLQDRHYWVVSPNVRNDEATVGAWRQASLLAKAAFMGWYPDEVGHGEMGPSFAKNIKPNDIILIARRHNHVPEIVGFGIVQGKYGNAEKLNGVKTPDTFGSLRKLRPFIPWSRPPTNLPLIEAIRHTRALAKLHPQTNLAHKRVCEWMEHQLNGNEGKNGETEMPSCVDLTRLRENPQLEYTIQTEKKIIQTKADEDKLLRDYHRWLKRQARKLSAVKYRSLRCDAYEEERQNLIEAKCSISREHIRMAVGQLLDYSFQGMKKFGEPHMAILLPKKPDQDIEDWLQHLKISIVWRDGTTFLDNANGQFS